jgi:predicted dienelactone hydrolase
MLSGRAVCLLSLLFTLPALAATDPMATVDPIAVPGPYPVACSNVAQDFTQAPTDDIRNAYWEGTGAGSPGMYVTQILLEPQGAFTYMANVPDVRALFVDFAGTPVPHLALVCYPTSAANPRPDYPVDSRQTLFVPKMQRGTDPPIWNDPGARYPVLLYSHGMTGSPLSDEYLQTGIAFASYGYVVVAPFHGDGRFANLSLSDFQDLTQLVFNNGYRKAIEMQAMRPVGLRAALDRLLADPNYRDHIDPNRIGGFGASLGGEGLLLQAGVPLTTDFFPSLKSQQVMPQDTRVKAIATYVPYFGQRLLPAFGDDEKGLAGFSTPFFSISGTADTVAPIDMVQQGVNWMQDARYVIAFNGLQHGLVLADVPDMFTWELAFLDAYLNPNAASRTRMARMAVVNGGADDSVRIDYTAPLPPAGDERIVTEFYNTSLGHFFITADAAEVASIDAGGSGPGWIHTPMVFKGWAREAASGLPLCRFYGTPGIGPNSHFYTLDPAECAAVKLDPGWTFEALAFRATLPVGGICPDQSIPVWRAYNNGFPRNDSNHRYTTSRSTYADMVQLGWSAEGVVYCSRP